VEKSDVIGAIFGQTEGLLGADLDLRELQKTGRIGRIEVEVKTIKGNSEGEVVIPSALDSSETALIAATLETIERVGPCDAEITLKSVEDVRAAKREYVIDRAKAILNQMGKNTPDLAEVSEHIKESVKTDEITSYKGMPCGPGITEADEIIVVEGRADVINLLKNGVNNVVAIGGTSINDAIVDLAKGRVVVLFIDGDRGGKLIAKSMMQKTNVDFVIMAPEGKEVEELNKTELYKALRTRMTAKEFREAEKKGKFKKLEEIPEKAKRDEAAGETPERGIEKKARFPGRDARRPAAGGREERPPRPVHLSEGQKSKFRETLENLVGTRAACIYDDKGDLLGKVPVPELERTLRTIENPHTIIFDGSVNVGLNALAKAKGVKFLVAMEKEGRLYGSVSIVTKADLA
jgi:DNA primase